MEMMIYEHKLVADAEATRAYYLAHPELCAQDQAHRNYVRWIDTLTHGEADFFHAFGIDDHSQCALKGCFVRTGGEIAVVDVVYCVAGHVTDEKLALFTFPDTVSAFSKMMIISYNYDIPALEGVSFEDFPDERFFLFVHVEIPWLLDAPCELPTFKESLAESEAEYRMNSREYLRNLLLATGQPHTFVEPEAGEQLKARCIERYVAPEHWAEAHNICYADDENYGYLWHIFSSGMHENLKGDAAREQYRTLCAEDYYVYLEHCDICFHVEGSILPSLEAIEKKRDIYVIAGSLDWIYARTHEDGWLGPYLGRDML